MIFVTVGTHEQQFDRLIRNIDELKRAGRINEEVFCQIGYCNYEPQYCSWERIIPYSKMQDSVLNARIIITHGGPASFLMALQYGKIPIVVPRRLEFGEHVNNHQVEFVQEISNRLGIIIPVFDMNILDKTIIEYDEIILSKNKNIKSNNLEFNLQLEQIVREML